MARRRASQWGVAGVNGAVALVLILLVGFLALVVNPPSPPGIAAFAPQAEKQITKAPLSQSSQNGEGNGECVQGQVCDGQAATTTTAPLNSLLRTGVPSSLQCFKWPDGSVTQTFDPQSPPCVAGWDDSKGNGGATSPGVTATEIRVAFPRSGATATWPQVKPIVDFFNTRFQFYGRKIRIVDFLSQQADKQATGGFNKPDLQRADAAQITQLGVFATHDFVDPLHYSWSLPEFRSILTRNKIISIHGGEMVPYGSSADLVAKLPYEWTYYAPMDGVMRNIGLMACKQLVGKLAVHGGEGTKDRMRKFAVMYPTDLLGGPLPGLNTMLDVLKGCGVTPRVVTFQYGDRNSSATRTAALNEMKSDGVTSIIWFPQGGGGTPTHTWQLAQNIRYFPEWVMIGWNNYQTAFELQNPTSQTRSAFGVGVWNKMPPGEQEVWVRAYLAAGGAPQALQTSTMPSGRPFYQELALLAAGIQMAGPNLTPETFAKGLQSTKFPNPGAGGPPFYQGAVGFGPNDVTMVDDFSAFWLDTRTPGKDVPGTPNSNTSRAMCYVDLGRRFALDTWPTTDGFYKGACR